MNARDPNTGEAEDRAELIRALILKDCRRLSEAVQNSQAWTLEGKLARKHFWAFFRQLRRLAKESGNDYLIRGVEMLYEDLRSKSPGLFAAGSIN
jgi:hypothetical protein